jgi:tetratricopeptide (TPR) repeat protein
MKGNLQTDMDRQTELLREIRIALQNNDYSMAIRSLEEIVLLVRERGDVGAEGRHLGNLALTYYRLGNPVMALTHFEQALHCARQDNDRLTENGLLGNMGNVLRELKQYDDAVDYLNQALLIAQELGDNRGRGIWLSNLALVYDDLHDYQESILLHANSVRVARQIHDLPALAVRLGNLGSSCIAAHQPEQAIEPFKEALQICEQLARLPDVAVRTRALADLYADLGRTWLPEERAYQCFGEALDYYGKAMLLMRELEDHAGEAQVIRRIGNLLVDAGQLEDAAQYLQVAQHMFETLGLNRQAERSRKTLEKLIAYLERDPNQS